MSNSLEKSLESTFCNALYMPPGTRSRAPSLSQNATISFDPIGTNSVNNTRTSSNKTCSFFACFFAIFCSVFKTAFAFLSPLLML